MSPNHKIWASTPELSGGQVVVYLMYRSDLGFRVGVTNKCRDIPFLGARAHFERAERVWILDICESREDALFREVFYSLKYGIPTCVFNGTERGLNQGRMNAIFSEFGQNGRRVLNDKDLSFGLPHWIACSYGKHGRTRRTVQLNAHSRKGTQVILQWTSGALDGRLSDINVKRRRGDRRVVRKCFSSYRDGLAFAEMLAERVDGTLSHRLSTLDRQAAGSLRQITASGVFAGMSVVALDNNGEVSLERVVSTERVEESAFVDLDVDDASNFFGNGILSHNSIYGWRGSAPWLLEDFLNEGPQISFFQLTTNFRSGQKILTAANGILRAANDRLFDGELQLGRTGVEGEISYNAYPTAKDEARAIVAKIRTSIAAGRKPSQIAVLYRINASAGLVEMGLIREKIPYRVAGRAFFGRPERPGGDLLPPACARP